MGITRFWMHGSSGFHNTGIGNDNSKNDAKAEFFDGQSGDYKRLPGKTGVVLYREPIGARIVFFDRGSKNKEKDGVARIFYPFPTTIQKPGERNFRMVRILFMWHTTDIQKMTIETVSIHMPQSTSANGIGSLFSAIDFIDFVPASAADLSDLPLLPSQVNDNQISVVNVNRFNSFDYPVGIEFTIRANDAKYSALRILAVGVDIDSTE